MLYFNTFSIKRAPSFFVFAVWIASAALLISEKRGLWEPTRIMHLCFLIVTVTVPMLIFGLEMKIRQSRDSEFMTKNRRIILTDEGLEYQGDRNKDTARDSWDDLMAVYETRSLFIVYKDRRNMFPLPKTGEDPDKLEAARQVFADNLGKNFRRR